MISKWGYDSDFEQLYTDNDRLYEELDKKTILITGATGLVGSCLTEFLIYLKSIKSIDIHISILSSSAKNIEERFGEHIKSGLVVPVVQDIRNSLPDNSYYDYIIHAANAANPRMYDEVPVDVIDITIKGTKNVLDYCKKQTKSPRVVFVSSVEVYGETKDITEDITEDIFGYTESKRLAETMCMSYCSQYGVNSAVARLSKTYGPSNSKTDSRIMAYILNQTVSGNDITLNSDGSRIFSFCYVTDAVTALLSILLKGGAGEAYNIADKNSVANLKQIAEISARLADVAVHFAPVGISAVSKDTVVNSQKIENLGWLPKTCLKAGLVKQYESQKNCRL